MPTFTFTVTDGQRRGIKLTVIHDELRRISAARIDREASCAYTRMSIGAGRPGAKTFQAPGGAVATSLTITLAQLRPLYTVDDVIKARVTALA